ncbi:MAG: hypothetical protein K1X55_10975 [Chitinophagales bacterium]|nr:hypothetical protein [Chitinophagales bacterium]
MLIILSCGCLFGQAPPDIESLKHSSTPKVVFNADSSIVNNDFKNSTTKTTDSIEMATVSSDFNVKYSKDSLKSPIVYHAVDSMVLDYPAKKVYLYGNAEVTYDDVNIKARFIEFNYGANEAYAIGGIKDSLNSLDKIQFSQGSEEYLADELRFNFKTQKGKSKGLITKYDEGYLHGMEIKVVNDSTLFGRNARYTTCEYEHPHFYIEVGKAKIIQDRVIVGKPANLVIEDVRTPLVLPFGIFPVFKQRTSGLILPRWGESRELGFFLQDGGYYWAINDKMDLTVTGTVYTLGSWNLNTTYNYRKNYKFSGSANVGISQTRTGEKRDPNYVKPGLDFFVNWNMTLDPKRLYNSNFTVSVYAGTRTFHQNTTADQQTFLSNTYRSSISYSKWWPGKPFRLSVSANHSQTTDTRRINFKVPEINFSVARINPFQKKVQNATKKWYENIGFSYTFDTRNELNTFDSLLGRPETYRTMQNGFLHQIPVTTNFKLFKSIVVSPSFNYREYWYLNQINKSFRVDTIINGIDTTYNASIVKDTISKFTTGRDFNLSVSASWRLYGTLQFKKGKLQAVRHVITPSLSLSYKPDFTKEHWGFYKYVQSDLEGDRQQYSIFENGIYGGPPTGKGGTFSFGFGNNLQIKVYSKKDSVTHSKKITLIDNLSLRMSYNFALDSFKLSRLSMSGGTNVIGNLLNLQFSTTLDPYYTDPVTNRRRNEFNIRNKEGFFRMTDFSVSLNGTVSSRNFNNKSSGKNFIENTTSPFGSNRGLLKNNISDIGSTYGEIDFAIPWTLGYSYSLGITKTYRNGNDTALINQNLSMNANFNVTPKWKVGVSSGYDFKNKQINNTSISVYRDLHCWQMAFNWIPIGSRQSFSIELNVKSQMLRQLRLSKRKSWFD